MEELRGLIYKWPEPFIFAALAEPAKNGGMDFDLITKMMSQSREANGQEPLTNTEVKRIAVGLDGRFADSSWTWDGYFQYGVTDRSQLVADNRHLNAYNYAIDAVIDTRVGSATNGQAICRATLQGSTDPIAKGCVALNPFGTGAMSKAAHDYAFGYLLEELNYKQSVLAFNTTGDLFEGFGAGTIKGAAGVEYRKEQGTNTGSQGGAPDYVRTDYLIQYGESFAGDVDVLEGYLEANVPVLRGVPGADRLEFDLSLRESQYKNKGKAGTTGARDRADDLAREVAALAITLHTSLIKSAVRDVLDR
jgi:hypothetical protein